MKSHVGIVACSAEGAALCFRTLCVEGESLFGPETHPHVTMHAPPFRDYMDLIRAGDWAGVAELMLASARIVAAAGAQFAVCPDNTIHQAFSLMIERSPIPWLHIARVVAEDAKARGFRRLAVLGTRYLMEGPVYPDALSAEGIEARVPNAGERQTINRVIFEELVRGRFPDSSRAELARIIGRMAKDDGCDAAVLGCTEIPLLIRSQQDSPLPTLDSTRLLARAALRRAAGTGG